MFEVGQRVRFAPNDVNDFLKRPHDYGVDWDTIYTIGKATDFVVKLEGINGLWMNQRFELVVEPEPVPEAPMVPFIFCGEINRKADGKLAMFNHYAIELFNSLEAAQAHCVVLRERHGTNNIHAYVRLGDV